MGAQVFFRYALNNSLFWSEEVGRICLVWITFLGGSAAFKRRAHLGIDFLVNRLPVRLRWMTQVTVLLASLCFFGVLIFYGTAFMAFIASQRTPALGMSMAVPYAAIPLSGLLFFLHGSSQLLELFGEASSSP
jgi:TRAP-type C4-dicarboxylate transport system permease small subunit